MLSIILEVILLFFLFFASVQDVRSKEVSLVMIGAGFLAGLILQLAAGGIGAWRFLLGCLPGCGMLLFSRLSGQAVGYGDSAVFTAAGVFLGPERILLLFLFSFLSAGAVSGVLLVMKKKNRRKELPFVPFMLAGFVSLLLIS